MLTRVRKCVNVIETVFLFIYYGRGVIVLKNKSFFSQLIILVVVSFLCILVTLGTAFLLGSYGEEIFNFENLNISNMIPVFIFGGLFSCVIVGITALFVLRNVFVKLFGNTDEDNKKGE